MTAHCFQLRTVLRQSIRLIVAGSLSAVALFHTASAEPLAADRIVSIGGAVTEIIYALGEEHRLVGRDTTSSYPPAAESLPDVGYMRALSPEGVLSLSPSRIIMVEGSGPPETLQVLREADIPISDVPETYSAEGVLEKIHVVGAALGASEKAEVLADKLRADFELLATTRNAASASPRVLFVLSVRGGRILASGTGTAADGILALAGMTNAITEFEGYKQLSDEAILTAAPDVILMMDRGGDHGGATAEILSLSTLAATPAGRSGYLVQMNGQLLLGFGPRTAEAAWELKNRVEKLLGGKGETL